MKNVLLILVFLSISCFGTAQQRIGFKGAYHKTNLNPGLFGNWKYSEEGHDFTLKLTAKKKVFLQPLNVYVDVFQGQFDYSKNGMNVAKNINSDRYQITYGFQNKANPNIVQGSILENGKRGSVTIELVDNDTIKFKVLASGSASQYKLSFSFPTQMTLKRAK